MNRDQAIAKLMPILHDTFDDDDILYRDDLTAADVEAWDSLSNIRFMVAIEQSFGVRFSNAEMESLSNLGELIELIEKHS